MNNAGMPAKKTVGAARRSVLVLSILALAIIGAAVIMLQFFPILYGIFFPPMPPVPANLTLIEHRNISYGVDEWNYSVKLHPCEVVNFYQQQGATCTSAFLCEGNTTESLVPAQHVAECVGAANFSQFAMRWTANISVSDVSGVETIFQISREVFWGGKIPPKMEDLVNQIEATNAALTPIPPTVVPQ